MDGLVSESRSAGPERETGSGGGDAERSGGSGAPPRLLFLCHTLPYPPDGGVWIRSFHVLSELAREFEVTALCFERSGQREHDSSQAIAHLSDLASTEVFDVPQESSVVRKTLDHLRSVGTGRPFTFYKHRSEAFEDRLRTLLERGRFDLIHVDSLDLAAHLPRLRKSAAPVVCVHHNIESMLLRRRSEAESNPVVSWYMRHQAGLQEAEERRWAGRIDLNVVVSQEDRDALAAIAPEASIEVIPNGVDTEYFTPAEVSEQGVVFVGSPGWFPNRDGMEYFCRQVLPQLRRRIEDVPVTWIGSAPEDLRETVEARYGVAMTGYVDDIRPFVHQAACFVVPLRVGGGSRLKILDAWAMGKAVVSTSVGCEGLAARDGENILIRDTPDSFAEAVETLLREKDARRRLGSSGRDTAERRYAWSVIGERMNEIYVKLAGRADAASEASTPPVSPGRG